jgi:hypothetical protein
MITRSGKIRVGDSDGALSPLVTTVADIYVSRTYHDAANLSGAIAGITGQTLGSQTVANALGGIRGLAASVGISATNTKNWTASVGLVGLNASIFTTAGATGTVTGATTIQASSTHSASGLTITTQRGIYNNLAQTGPVENSIVYQGVSGGAATNNTFILLDTINPIAGNWGIYNASSYDNVTKGRQLINTDVRTTSAGLEVAGGVDVTSGGISENGVPVATTAQNSWISPTLLNSWANTGGTRPVVQYYKDQFGIVHLKGDTSGGTTDIIFNLPAGYRPSEDMHYPAIDTFTGTPIWVAVTIAGDVQVSYFTGGAIINNISFRV